MNAKAIVYCALLWNSIGAIILDSKPAAQVYMLAIACVMLYFIIDWEVPKQP